jgi:hypothetical protein
LATKIGVNVDLLSIPLKYDDSLSPLSNHELKNKKNKI